ncbi:MAG: SGNH/GDSL hydrolase family protein [Syntrophobacterales bacterium]|nr:MAG: SGNH/GDSL hydrolase family protein [Syntrophobacterales bacterium]
MKYVAFTLVLFLVFMGIIELSILGVRIYRGQRIAAESTPYEASRPNASKSLLIVGDSTGVGTGAVRPQESIAGRIAVEFTDVNITNLSTNGAMVRDVYEQLQGTGDRSFDVILMHAGANDILYFSPLERLRESVHALLESARKKGGYVIFLSNGNIGLAPAFFPPLSWIYTWRAKKVRRLFMDAAAELGVQYVDLFREKGDDPFSADPEQFYARDFLHPGSEGYRYWYREIKAQSSLATALGS